MLGGAGLYGGLVGYLQSRGQLTTNPAGADLVTVGRVLWGVAIVACVFIWNRVRIERNFEKVLSLSIIGWAFGEAVALFGATFWFLVGTSNWYFPGLGFLALVLLALPGVRRH
jgi:hypothetical protein